MSQCSSTCGFGQAPASGPSGQADPDRVLFFTPYPFYVGQKIHIMDGPRRGDWQVIKVGEGKMTLKCPISFKELEVDRFCCLVEEKTGVPWPQR